MNGLDFLYRVKGLGATFQAIISSEIPAKCILSWDFGDDKVDFNTRNAKHEYSEPGFYTVTLNATNTDGLNVSVSHTIAVSDKVKTTLTGSIYELIDNYIPKELVDGMPLETKRVFINKWQMYIQPLVNHCIPVEEYNNELYYEGLENQLIMELAVWDYLNANIHQMLIKAGTYISNITTIGGDNPEGSVDVSRGDRIKQITTGPTEVQFYDTLSDPVSTLYNSYAKALQPGGIIDEIRKNLCMLAQRLDIYLPFCDEPNHVKVPRIVNHRKPGPLGGPNPTSVLNLNKK